MSLINITSNESAQRPRPYCGEERGEKTPGEGKVKGKARKEWIPGEANKVKRETPGEEKARRWEQAGVSLTSCFAAFGLSTPEIQLIQEVLQDQQDIQDRVNDILGEKAPGTAWTKLRDVSLYLSIADRHANRKEFHALVLKINQAVHDTAQPVWQDLLDAISVKLEDKGPAEDYLSVRQQYNIDVKSFAHIHAEPAIRDTGLEGHSPSAMIREMIHYLGSKAPEFKAMLEETLTLDMEAAHTPESLHKVLGAYCHTMQTKLTQLKMGQRLLIPCGWCKVDRGHTMYMLAERDCENKFKVVLFNSGAGLEYHPGIILNENLLKQPFIEIEGVEESALTNQTFLTALLELLTVMKNEEDRSTEYSQRDVYLGLIKALGGTVVKASENQEDYSQTPRVGICTWGALVASAKYLLKKEEFRRIHYEIRLNSLCDFFLNKKALFAKDEELAMLAEKSAEQFARDVLIDFEQGTITQQELQRVHTTLQVIFTHIHLSNRLQQQEAGKSRQIELDKLQEIPVFEGADLSLQEMKKLPSQSSLSVGPHIPPFVESPGTVVENLVKFRTWCEQFDLKVAQDVLNYSLQNFYRNLPPATLQNNFWETIPENQRAACLMELTAIGEIAFKTATIDKHDHFIWMQMGALKAVAAIFCLSKTPYRLPLDILIGFSVGDANGRPLQDKNIYDPKMRQDVSDVVAYLQATHQPKALTFAPYERRDLSSLLSYKFDLFGGCREENYDQRMIFTAFCNREIMDKLFHAKPELKAASLAKQMAELIADFSGNYLPLEHCALRKQLYYAASLASHNNPTPITPTDYEFLTRHFNISLGDKDLAVKQNNPCFGQQFDQFFVHLLHIARTTQTQSYETFFGSHKYDHSEYTSKALETRDGKLEVLLKKSSHSVEEVKALLSLMTYGDKDGAENHMEMQPLKTLSYFTEHLSQLQNPNYLELFRLLVFENNYLEKLLIKNPSFADSLRAFVELGLDKFGDKGDYATQVFFIELSRTFETIVRFTVPHSSVVFPDPFRFLRQLINRSDLSTDLKVLVSQHLAASYASHGPRELTLEQARELLVAMGMIRQHFGTHMIEDQWQTSHLTLEFKSILVRYSAEIEKLVKGAQGGKLLKLTTQALKGPETTPEDWSTAQYPLCTTTKGVSFNVRVASLYRSGQQIAKIPSFLRDNHFNEVFGEGEFLAQHSDGQDHYEFVDEEGRGAKVRSELDQLLIQRELEPNRWFQKLSGESLTKIHDIVGSFVQLEHFTIWQSLSDGEPTTLWMYNKERKPLYRISLNSESKIEKVENLRPDGTIWTLTDPDSPLNPFKQFSDFSQAKWLLWKNAQGVPVALQSPLQDLEFNLSKTARGWIANSKEYPGYWISTNQNIKGLQGFTAGVVLEGPKGVRKMLIPRLPLQINVAGALNRQVGFIEATEPPPILCYEIDRKQGVKTATREEKLMLAYLHFGRKEYRQAQDLLRKTHSPAIPYTEEEQKILDWFIDLKERMKDGDPAASALALTAFVHKLRDHPDKLPKDKHTLQMIDQFIMEYLSLHPIAHALTEAEELTLLVYAAGRAETSMVALLRLEKMKKGSSLLGSLSQPVKEPEPSHYDVKSAFDSLRMDLLGAKSSPSSAFPLVTRPGKNFLRMAQEDHLYKRLQAQDPIARMQLDFARHDPSVNRLFVDILDAVSKNPQRFPDEAVFYSCLTDFKTFERQIDQTDFKPDIPVFIRKKPETHRVAPPLLAKPNVHPASPLGEYATYFKEVPFVGLQLKQEEIKELQQAVDISHKSPLAAAKSAELKEDIATAWSNPPAFRPILQPQKAEPLKIRLLVQEAEEAKLLAQATLELLAIANTPPKEPLKNTLAGLETQGKLLTPVTFQDLCLILAKRDASILRKLNPALEDAQIQQVYAGTLQVLEQAKRVQRIKRSLANLEQLVKLSPTELGVLDLSQKLLHNLTRPLAYNPVEHPEYSLFEFLADIQLYEGQVHDLTTLMASGENANIILQKIMGSGKSKVFLPLLALNKADGQCLTTIVVPASQFDTTLRDMEAASGQIFNQTTHTFAFHRNSDCSSEALRDLRNRLQEIIVKKDYLLVTDTTLHCLIDKAKEMMFNFLESPQAAAPPELIEMRLLLALFKKGILDEADLLLNGRHEVNFTLGEPEAIVKEHSSVVREIFECLYGSPEILSTITPKGGEEPAITQEQFIQEVRPKAAEAFLHFESKRLNLLGRSLQALSEKDKALVLDYWMNGSAGDLYVASLKDEKLQNALAIVKEELNELLPITLSKTLNFRFGLSDDPQEVLAVPYIGNNKPSPTSRYGNPYELLNYTTQMYLLQGIPESTLRALIKRFQEEALKELAIDATLTVKQTEVHKQFLALCGGDEAMNLMRMTDRDFAKLTLRYKQNKEAVFEFLEKYIYQLVTIYPGKLTSHHLNLVDLFSEQVIGFTGTPWNKDLYHGRLRTLIEAGTDGKTLGILKKNSSKILSLESNKHVEILDELFKGMESTSPYRTLQDAGAVFNGIDNQTIAEEILKRAPASIKGVKFYSDKNQIVILERGKKVALPVAKSRLSMEECFTYYDQWHTASTDIAQMYNAKGFVTIGKTINSRDLRQGVWRLRGLETGQIATLIVTPEAAGLIRKELGLPVDAKLGLVEVIKFNELNLYRELETQLPSNVFQRLSHVSANAVWQILMNPETNLGKIDSCAKELKEMLRCKQEDKPYKNFGRKEESVDTPILIQEKCEADLSVIESLRSKHPAFASIDLQKMRESMQKAVPVGLLPPKTTRPIRTNRELTVEVERNLAREEEKNVQRIKELENQAQEDQTAKGEFWHWNWCEAKIPLTSREFFTLQSHHKIIDFPKHYQGHQQPYYDASKLRTMSRGIPPVETLAERFFYDGMNEYKEIFDLESSANFLPINHELRAKAFDKQQLEVKQFLILHDNATGQRRQILISAADTGFFYSALAEAKKKPKEHKELSILLVDLRLGVVQSDDEALANQIASSPEWARYMAQAKFYNGDLVYNRQEQAYLKKWIKEKGVKKMEGLFFQRILRYKPSKKKLYNASVLCRLFAELQET